LALVVFYCLVGIVIFIHPTNENASARYRALNAKRIALELMPQANASMSLPYFKQFCCSLLVSGED